MHKELSVKSRVRGDFHARFCERVRVKLPRSTRPNDSMIPGIPISMAASYSEIALVIEGATPKFSCQSKAILTSLFLNVILSFVIFGIFINNSTAKVTNKS